MEQAFKNISACQLMDCGCMDYKQTYAIQKKCVEETLQGADPTIMICEHPLVLTMGRLSKEENILCSQDTLQKRNIEVIRVDRGGQVTLHAPGQMMVYPILDLRKYKKDLKYYFRILEQVGIDLLNCFDILGSRLSGKTGVFVGDKKLISIGIGIRKWISFHGMAINVNTDLELFSMIKPCGLDVSMTSMSQIKQRQIHMSEVKTRLIDCFCRRFGLVIQQEVGVK